MSFAKITGLDEHFIELRLSEIKKIDPLTEEEVTEVIAELKTGGATDEDIDKLIDLLSEFSEAIHGNK